MGQHKELNTEEGLDLVRFAAYILVVLVVLGVLFGVVYPASEDPPLPVPPSPAKRGRGRTEVRAKRSAFAFYGREIRVELQRRHPEKSSSEIAHMIVEFWRNMGERERAPFYELADRDEERYWRDARTHDENDAEMRLDHQKSL